MSALIALSNAYVRLGDVQALAGVSLDVAAGEIVALLGPNGAGKTTLLQAALGFAPLIDGSARLGGDDPRTLSARTRALRAAYLPQRASAIWPLSVERLVALGRFAHGAAPDRLGPRDQAAVDDALAACSLTPLRRRRVDQISGGERARAHLARALAQAAPVLVLDEPTASLDPAQTLDVAAVLERHRAGGGAALIATHDIGLAARIADRAVLLREGRVVAEGEPLAALSPEALAAAFGRTGVIVRTEGGIAAAFS